MITLTTIPKICPIEGYVKIFVNRNKKNSIKLKDIKDLGKVIVTFKKYGHGSKHDCRWKNIIFGSKTGKKDILLMMIFSLHGNINKSILEYLQKKNLVLLLIGKKFGEIGIHYIRKIVVGEHKKECLEE